MSDRKFITVTGWSDFNGAAQGRIDIAVDQIASIQSRELSHLHGGRSDGTTISLANGIVITSADSVERIRILMEQATHV